MGKFTIRSVASGVKFDLKSSNGQVILTSEVYTSAALCRKGVDSVIRSAVNAGVEDQTDGGAAALRNPKFELYEDRAGQFRFRLKSRNGKIIGISEGYATKANCLHGIESVRSNLADAQIEEEILWHSTSRKRLKKS